MSRPRYVEVVRRLVLSTPIVVGCAAPTTSGPTAGAAQPALVPSASATADDTTACRCAWDTDAKSAPRVCADGAINHAGEPCVRGADHSTGSPPTSNQPILLPPVVGPLAPPDLPARV